MGWTTVSFHYFAFKNRSGSMAIEGSCVIKEIGEMIGRIKLLAIKNALYK